MKALLVIDMLEDFINKKGALYVGHSGETIVPFVKQKIQEFREQQNPVVFICDNHQKDDREFEMFPPHCIANTTGSNIIRELDARDDDKIIRKRRYSAFFGTDLDIYLREKGIYEIYLAGVCTNICVLYTAADARNLGYRVNVYKEGVASFDEKSHDFALNEMEKTLGCRIL
ncbi:MAG: nicotinamidase/pyrazinamidase [Tepidanaerobacteraceae bacterium]|nr:nicotinamidase/pyrazinamidase [Tepidanaerobacteraceae bacterium]